MKAKTRFVPAVLAIAPALFGCTNGGTETDETVRYREGIYAGEAAGYHATYVSGTPVTLEVTFTAEAITGVSVTDHNESASREAVGKALTQIPQSILKGQSADVAAVSGASYTSGAIINAVKDCLSQAALPGGGYMAGTYRASAGGYHSAQNTGVPVKVRVDFSSAAITNVKIISHSETESRKEVKNALTQIPKAVLDRQSADVDGMTGATCTSNAIIEAVKHCISQAELF
jgi:uncharacterized protein with FMN-binding domain